MQIEACYFYRHPQFLMIGRWPRLKIRKEIILKYLAKKELERERDAFNTIL